MSSQANQHTACKGPLTVESKQEKATGGVKARHPDARVMESGLIYWFYRPKVGQEEAHSFQEVQRLYFLLAPSACPANPREGNDKMPKRLFVMTSKKMPTAGSHTRHWAFLDVVSHNVKEVHDVLDKIEYETKTKGHRTVEAARPAGEGIYELLYVPSRPQSCLAYVLEVPSKPGEVQKSFNIEKEASYIIQVKNPENSTEGAPGLAQHQKVHFPKHLMEKFVGKRVATRKFIPLDTPEFLNYPHAEILLIGESENLADEFGEVGESLEKAEKHDESHMQQVLKGHLEEEPYKELGLEKEEHPDKALKGKWV